MNCHAILLPSLLLALASTAPAQFCSGLEELYPLSGDRVTMTSDGSMVLAGCCLWSETMGVRSISNVVGLGLSSPILSGDGQVIVGNVGFAVFRWTAATGAQFIGTTFPAVLPEQAAIDEDGDVFVGPISQGGGFVIGGVWSPAGVQLLTSPGMGDVTPTAVSGDGTTVVGYMRPNQTVQGRAFRWTAALGVEDLGALLPGGWASARGVNYDGSVIVGVAATSGGSSAFVWTAADGMQPLDLPPGALSSSASAVSDDGRFIVGEFRDSTMTTRPVRWSTSGGAAPLPFPAVLASGGAVAHAISADGTYTVGRPLSSTPIPPVFRVRTTQIGASFCSNANPNSTGCSSVLDVLGNAVVSDNSVTLATRRLPVDVFGFFLISGATGNTPLTNSQGILCLGGFIGRFVGPGQILNSGLDGSFALAIDLGNVPLQFGSGSVQPGETWNFQAWHRDVDGSGAPTSNLTDAVAVTFR